MTEIDTTQMIEMKVTGLTMDPFTNMPIIILKDLEEQNTLPIWIGLVEASSIATQLESIQTPRPLSHDLMKEVFDQLKVGLNQVFIVDLRDNTFYANIALQHDGKEYIIDCRPSDALALALRTNASVFVNPKVIEKAKKLELPESAQNQPKDKWSEILEGLSPEDFGKYKM